MARPRTTGNSQAVLAAQFPRGLTQEGQKDTVVLRSRSSTPGVQQLQALSRRVWLQPGLMGTEAGDGQQQRQAVRPRTGKLGFHLSDRKLPNSKLKV